MSGTEGRSTAALLREQFDRGFAEAAAAGDDAWQDYLAVDAGGATVLLPLGDVAGVVADRTIVEIPAARTGFLGLIAHAGNAMPVYELAALLGHRAGMRRDDVPLVLARDAAVAFAVDGVRGRRRLPSSDGQQPVHLHTLWLDDRSTTIVRLPAVLAGLAARGTDPAREDDR